VIAASKMKFSSGQLVLIMINMSLLHEVELVLQVTYCFAQEMMLK
jgi:hypothetical protein